MFDIGWPELMVIAVLTVMIVGPKELPRVIRSVTGIVRKVRMMTSEFQSGLDEMAREADLDDIKKKMMETSTKGIGGEIEKAMDPAGDIKSSLDDMKTDLEKGKDKINEAGQEDEPKQVSQESKAFADIVKAKKSGIPLGKDNPNAASAKAETSLTKQETKPAAKKAKAKVAAVKKAKTSKTVSTKTAAKKSPPKEKKKA